VGGRYCDAGLRGLARRLPAEPGRAGLLELFLCGGSLRVCSGSGRRTPSGVGAGGVAQDHGDHTGWVVRQDVSSLDGGGLRAESGGRLVRLGVGQALGGTVHVVLRPGSLRPDAGLARGAGRGGAGAELADVLWGATLEGAGAGVRVEAEVAADLGDDVGDGTACDVVVEVGAVQAVAQLGVQAVLQVGGQGGAAASVAAWALDGVLDLAEDAPAGVCAVPGRVRGGLDGAGEAVGEEDAAPDGADGAVEGRSDGGEGVRDGDARRRGRRGLRPGGLLRGLGLRRGLLVQEAGQVGAHGDEFVQDLGVVVRVRGAVAGIVLRGGLVRQCGHERKKNIVGGPASRMAWVDWENNAGAGRGSAAVPGRGVAPYGVPVGFRAAETTVLAFMT